MQVITDSWVMAARMRRESRRQTEGRQAPSAPVAEDRVPNPAQTRTPAVWPRSKTVFPSSMRRHRHPAGAVWE